MPVSSELAKLHIVQGKDTGTKTGSEQEKSEVKKATVPTKVNEKEGSKKVTSSTEFVSGCTVVSHTGWEGVSCREHTQESF